MKRKVKFHQIITVMTGIDSLDQHCLYGLDINGQVWMSKFGGAWKLIEASEEASDLGDDDLCGAV